MAGYHVRQNGTWVDPCITPVSFYKANAWHTLPVSFYVRIGTAWVAAGCVTTKVNWTISFPNLFSTAPDDFLYEIQYNVDRVLSRTTVYGAPPDQTQQVYIADMGSSCTIQWNSTKVRVVLNGITLTGDGTVYGSNYTIDTSRDFNIIITQ